jgi:hypothetical protein
MASKLSIFNAALRLLGERSLGAVGEPTEPGRILRDLWPHTLRFCISQHTWRFAAKYAELTDTAIPEAYGLAGGFNKPEDFIRLLAAASDVEMETPVQDLYEFQKHFRSDVDTLHIWYVAAPDPCQDEYDWPEPFVEYVHYYLAARAAPHIQSGLIPQAAQAQSDEDGRVSGGGYLGIGMQSALQAAITFDTANGPQQFLPTAPSTKLGIINDALTMISGPTLTRLTDATEHARLMLHLWEAAVAYCLEQGHWKFALKEAKLEPSVTEIPDYGFRHAFEKPDDMVRLSGMAADDYFRSVVTGVSERGQFWYAEWDNLYIRYVSNDATLGNNMDVWPSSYKLFFTLYLASIAASRLSPQLKQDLIRAPGNIGLEEAKYNALSKDAVSGPTQFLPPGNWVTGRMRGSVFAGRRRNSLYGN